MGTTSLGIPYPDSGDNYEPHLDMQALAEETDDQLLLVRSSPACFAYRSAALSISNNTATVISLDAEDNDNSSMHSTSSNTSRVVAPVAGVYLFIARATWLGNATGTRRLDIRKNSGGSGSGGTLLAYEGPNAWGGASSATINRVEWMGPLAANDYIELAVTQTSGGSLGLFLNGTGGWATNFVSVMGHLITRT